MQSLFKAYAFGAALTFSLLTIAAEAQVAKPQVMFSGFATLAAGKIIGGSHDELVDLDYQCPCFISDYAQNGVYEQKRLRLGPDSKLGVQGQVSSANGQYSLTGQLVSRGAAGGNINLEWLYATAEISWVRCSVRRPPGRRTWSSS